MSDANALVLQLLIDRQREIEDLRAANQALHRRVGELEEGQDARLSDTSGA
jgi:hypothetical protein